MKRSWPIGIGVLGTLTIVLDFIYRHHAHTESWWHITPAFDLVYGFTGCVGIVLLAKWLGVAWLQRGEDYYEDEVQ